MEFTSAGIINPVWNSGERITRLAIFEGEKIRGITGKSKFGSQKVNHFVAGFRGMMKNNETVQGVDDDMILVVLNFCRKEFIDFLLVIIEFSRVEPGIRRVGGVGAFVMSKCLQNRMPSPNESPRKGGGITSNYGEVPLRKGSPKTIKGISFCMSKAHITFVNERGG